MPKNRFLVLLTICLCFNFNQLFSQKNIIKWNKEIKLNWNDFNIKKGSKLAYSAVAIKLNPTLSNTKRIKLEVYAYFDKEISRTGIFDDDVLAHEQLHFLIGELFARKLRKQILQFDKRKFFKDRNHFNVLYQKNYQAYLEYQKRYDKETVNSVNKIEQKRWVEKVKDDLTTYKNYTNQVIDLYR